ncbi:hypothetical protein SAMN06269185_0682 [Natronoarchaeum philippinense]|uniref:DUF7508 domain-containing protein n=1 Tax=Natronoarchaeum philippinense TaxID=558529 RepID=A0A285N5W5_NATPI|nr:hypothetical protein [Natronoarchaeum philippinense]SNZ04799.1 hypothetical protein SAMN06269185_0682 [Natronoarchaeum philippinense]
MPLAKQWRDLDRSTVGRAPDRYGVVEFGDADGEVLDIETGVLRDAVKSALAYRDAPKVRWEATQTRAQAEELADEHRDRLDE